MKQDENNKMGLGREKDGEKEGRRRGGGRYEGKRVSKYMCIMMILVSTEVKI